VERFWLPTFGPYRISQIQRPELERWYVDMLEDDYGPGYIRFILDIPMSFLRQAHDGGRIASVPSVRKLGSRYKRRKGYALTIPEQLDLLVDAFPHRYQALVFMLPTTGLRIGEALAPQVFDFQRRIVHVEKNRLGDGTIKPEPKSAAGNRLVPLPIETIIRLQNHLDMYGYNSEGGLFTNLSGKPLSYAAFNQAFEKRVDRIRRKHSDFPDIVIHDLRKTYGAHMLDQGVKPNELAKIVGHENEAITLTTYTPLILNRREAPEAVERMVTSYQLQRADDADIIEADIIEADIIEVEAPAALPGARDFSKQGMKECAWEGCTKGEGSGRKWFPVNRSNQIYCSYEGPQSCYAQRNLAYERDKRARVLVEARANGHKKIPAKDIRRPQQRKGPRGRRGDLTKCQLEGCPHWFVAVYGNEVYCPPETGRDCKKLGTLAKKRAAQRETYAARRAAGLSPKEAAG
jgi:integrase